MKIKKKELLLSCWVQTAKCNYYVDGYSGYVADVQYDGYAKAYDYKPAYKASYEPTYSAPAYKPAHY